MRGADRGISVYLHSVIVTIVRIMIVKHVRF